MVFIRPGVFIPIVDSLNINLGMHNPAFILLFCVIAIMKSLHNVVDVSFLSEGTSLLDFCILI